jgi:hypothetical protein
VSKHLRAIKNREKDVRYNISEETIDSIHSSRINIKISSLIGRLTCVGRREVIQMLCILQHITDFFSLHLFGEFPRKTH